MKDNREEQGNATFQSGYYPPRPPEDTPQQPKKPKQPKRPQQRQQPQQHQRPKQQQRPQQPNQPQPKRTEPPKSVKPKINWLRLGILVCAVGVMVFCLYNLISYFSDHLRTRQQGEELREVYYAEEASSPAGDAPNAPTTAETGGTLQTSEGTAAALQTAEGSAAVSQTADVSPSAASQASGQTARMQSGDGTSAAAPQTAAPAPASGQAPVAPASPAITPAPRATEAPVYPDNPRMTVSERFKKLRRRNKDIVGWITIDGVLDEAVVQRDNSYYLKRDYLGYHNVTGALFLDENCDITHAQDQFLIHGHNMKTGAMFGILKKYKVNGASFYKEHPYITFNTLYEEAKYVIFAVAEVNIRADQYGYVNFMGMNVIPSDEDYAAYVALLKKKSRLNCPVDALPGDRLLVLATCTGTDEDTRLLVVARKLRGDEDEIAMNTDILSTRDR